MGGRLPRSGDSGEIVWPPGGVVFRRFGPLSSARFMAQGRVGREPPKVFCTYTLSYLIMESWRPTQTCPVIWWAADSMCRPSNVKLKCCSLARWDSQRCSSTQCTSRRIDRRAVCTIMHFVTIGTHTCDIVAYSSLTKHPYLCLSHHFLSILYIV